MRKNYLISTALLVMFGFSGYASAESHYPATDYKPKVVYQDKELIEMHKEAAKTRVVPDVKETKGEQSTSVSTGTSEVAETKKGASDDNSMLLILVVVAGVAGFVLFNKSKGTASSGTGYSKVYTADPSGLTGVDRYLKLKEEASKTGVQKYLDKQETELASAETVKTGVEKYLENKVEEAATGVEKYIRKNG